MNMRLGHYDIIEEIGRGGMGVVYKGYEAALGRFVAIKALSATMAHDKVFVERFLREARAMAALNDSHIIQIYFIGQDQDQTFFVMELIDGDSLSGFIKRDGRLDPADALKILLHASQGLAVAHAQGVIHRDIKPANIMITSRGQVKVADFGIAIANHDFDSKLTGTGQLVGTPGYLSPEVCLGKPVDARSDIFALGIVLFEMLTGRMPFQDESPLRLMLDVVQADAPDVRKLVPAVDEEAARILGRMLAKDPADRYQSCPELIADLKLHPLISQSGPLKLRPSPRTGASPTDPTVVGMPTPLTPSVSARRSPPPPVVSSGSQPRNTPSAAAANATLVTPLPPAAAKRSGARRVVTWSLVVVAMGALAWLIGRNGPAKPVATVPAPVATVTAAAPTVPKPPAPPAKPAPATSPTGEIAAAARDAGAPVASVTMPVKSLVDVKPDTPKPVVTIRYGHGGPNSRGNRVRVRAEIEPTPEELLAREQARQQNEAAVAAAAAQQAPATPESPAKPTAKKSGFLCRVFGKCAQPRKPASAAPATSPPPGG